MNATLIRRLADYVESLPPAVRYDPRRGRGVPVAPPEGATPDTILYDQGTYVERIECGTKCCIAGALALMIGDPLVIGDAHSTEFVRAPQPYPSWSRYVSATLGISLYLADEITATRLDDIEDRSPSPGEAAAAIRALLDAPPEPEETDTQQYPWSPWDGVLETPVRSQTERTAR